MNDDLISRKAAIGELTENKEMINAVLDSLTLDYNTRRNQEQRRGQINEDIETIKALPSAQPERETAKFIRWMECKKRDADVVVPAIYEKIKSLPPAQPELIEKEAYIRGFEQGRTQGMIDTKAEEVAPPNLQPTCNQLATDCISRKAALDGISDYLEEYDGIDENGNHDLKWCAMKEAELLIKDSPSAQPATNCSEFPNTSDVVSRKAVREMVSTWAYDMAEWEDMELALHDVDELPTAQPEVIHCKDCKHLQKWRSEESAKKFGQIYECARNVFDCPKPEDFCSHAERKQK